MRSLQVLKSSRFQGKEHNIFTTEPCIPVYTCQRALYWKGSVEMEVEALLGEWVYCNVLERVYCHVWPTEIFLVRCGNDS